MAQLITLDRDNRTTGRRYTRGRSGRSMPRVLQRECITNVGSLERLACSLGGAVLTGYGLAQRSLGGLALAALGGGLLYRGVTGHCPAYGSLGISTAEPRSPGAAIPAGQGIKIEKAVTVRRQADELYRFWRNFNNLPRIMRHLESVQVETAYRSRWASKGPLGTKVEWDAEIINERSPELIAWRSLPGSVVDTAGSVHFRPLGDGSTEVRVVLKYNPPAGKLGAAVANFLGEAPEQQIEDDLNQFRIMMESQASATTGSV